MLTSLKFSLTETSLLENTTPVYWTLVLLDRVGKPYFGIKPYAYGNAVTNPHSKLTRYHGLRRARYRGLSKVSLQCYFMALAVNIKRWVKMLVEKITLKTAVVAVS